MANVEPETVDLGHRNMTLPRVNSTLDVLDSRYVWLIAAPLILFVGAAANGFQLLVLRRRGSWRTSTNSFLTVMSAAHFAVLFAGPMLQWLDKGYGVRPAEWSPGVCRWSVFFQHGSFDVAAWLLVGLVTSAEVPAISPKSAVVYSACLTVAVCVKNAVLFWTNGPVFDGSGRLVTVCGTPKEFATFEAFVRPWLFHCIGVVIPSIAVIVLSSLLLLGVRIDGVKQVIRARIAPLWPTATAGLNKLSESPQLKHKNQDAITTTKTVLTGNNNNMNSNDVKSLAVYLSVSFVGLVSLPSAVIMLLCPHVSDHGANTDLATAIVRNIGYAYFASSFLLFCVVGNVDWAEFVAVLRRKPTPAQLRAASYRQKMRQWLRSESGRRMEFYSVRIFPVNVTEHLTVETISGNIRSTAYERSG